MLPNISANTSAVMSSQEAEEPEATRTVSLSSWSVLTVPAPALSLPGQFAPFPHAPAPLAGWIGTSSHRGQCLHLGKDLCLLPCHRVLFKYLFRIWPRLGEGRVTPTQTTKKQNSVDTLSKPGFLAAMTRTPGLFYITPRGQTSHLLCECNCLR